jgi:hypothetical protein
MALELCREQVAVLCVARSEVVGTISSRALAWRASCPIIVRNLRRDFPTGHPDACQCESPMKQLFNAAFAAARRLSGPKTSPPLVDTVCDFTTSDPAKHTYGRHYSMRTGDRPSHVKSDAHIRLTITSVWLYTSHRGSMGKSDDSARRCAADDLSPAWCHCRRRGPTATGVTVRPCHCHGAPLWHSMELKSGPVPPCHRDAGRKACSLGQRALKRGDVAVSSYRVAYALGHGGAGSALGLVHDSRIKRFYISCAACAVR